MALQGRDAENVVQLTSSTTWKRSTTVICDRAVWFSAAASRKSRLSSLFCLGFLAVVSITNVLLAGVDSEASVDQFPLFATKCYQTASERIRKLLKLVDLVGIEPTTSSMPWKHQGSRPLILKQLMAGQAGKTGINSAICYQIATKLNEWDQGADSWGISPSHRSRVVSVIRKSPDLIGRAYSFKSCDRESISQPFS